MTPTAANWDAPVNTSSDITDAWATDNPDATASTPKEIPKIPTAKPRTTSPGSAPPVRSSRHPATTTDRKVHTVELSELFIREAVRDLVARYTQAGDRGRLEDLAQLFARDGVLDVGDHGGRWEGRTEIERRLAAVAQRVAAEGSTPTRVQHHVSGMAITIETDSTAAAESYFAVHTAIGLDHWGRYRDRFTLTDGAWRFAERIVKVDGQASGSLMVAPAPDA